MNGSSGNRSTWRSIAGVLAGALVGILAGESLFRAITPVRPPMVEAEDGIAWIASHDPTTLVLGSSHARSFTPLHDMLAERTGGREQLAVVALEYGTITSYSWLVDHRLLPLIDEKQPDGTRLRPSLKRAVVVTDWWDACGRIHGPASTNLPARAWAFGDFVSDLFANGLTDLNGNYLQNRLNRWFRDSVMVRSRGHEYLPEALRELVTHKDEAQIRTDLQRTIDEWRDVAEGATGCEDPEQRQALDHVVSAFTSRGIEVTLLLFPGMPVTLTDRAKETTLAEFSGWAGSFANARGLRFVDIATTSPMRDEDWEHDLDHLTAAGTQRFSSWILGGPLNFLLDPRSTR